MFNSAILSGGLPDMLFFAATAAAALPAACAAAFSFRRQDDPSKPEAMQAPPAEQPWLDRTEARLERRALQLDLQELMLASRSLRLDLQSFLQSMQRVVVPASAVPTATSATASAQPATPNDVQEPKVETKQAHVRTEPISLEELWHILPVYFSGKTLIPRAPDAHPKNPAPATETEKLQRELDDWVGRGMDKYEVGHEYERYVGWLFEYDGWRVRYRGIQRGKNDGGCDLEAEKDGDLLYIQCKRWATIMNDQSAVSKLHDACTAWAAENPKGPVAAGVLVCSECASNEVLTLAHGNNIAVCQNIGFKRPPAVKCLEKDYLLPWDNGYDEVNHLFRVGTVQEAEDRGLRHAGGHSPLPKKWLNSAGASQQAV